jgi:hypothetical protein
MVSSPTSVNFTYYVKITKREVRLRHPPKLRATG